MKRLLAIALLVAACGGSGALPLVDPSSRSATEEPLATEFIASEAPASDSPEAPPLPVTVTKKPGAVAQGGTASVSIKTTKKAKCTIDIEYSSGSSEAAGLGPKTADAKGAITWKWMVGRNTTEGKWPVDIACSLGERAGGADTSLTVK